MVKHKNNTLYAPTKLNHICKTFPLQNARKEMSTLFKYNSACIYKVIQM